MTDKQENKQNDDLQFNHPSGEKLMERSFERTNDPRTNDPWKQENEHTPYCPDEYNKKNELRPCPWTRQSIEGLFASGDVDAILSFIRAVNSHEALLEAVKEAKVLASTIEQSNIGKAGQIGGVKWQSMSDWAGQVKEKLKKVIAQAEGKNP